MTPPEPPQYTKYRARPSLLRRRRAGGGPLDGLRRKRSGAVDGSSAGGPGPLTHGRPRLTVKRVLKYVAAVIAAWIAVSVVLFLVSAQIEQSKVSDATEAALDGGGLPVAAPTNILVLGSDRRPEGSMEPGANSGPSRSDSIMLLRIGGGANSRMSIARDTVVDIPGAGRQKINAAYAIGGPALAIRTVKQYLGVEVNHVIEVSFSEFPDLIDAMGGIDYREADGGCVHARINGGRRNGGVTIRIRRDQEKHLNGRQALGLARARTNLCDSSEDDLTRARRQQRIIGAMRSRVLGIHGFARLPWIAWQTPRTFRSDMSGPTLMTVFGWMAVGGTPQTVVLGTVSGEVPDSLRERRVEKFLEG